MGRARTAGRAATEPGEQGRSIRAERRQGRCLCLAAARPRKYVWRRGQVGCARLGASAALAGGVSGAASIPTERVLTSLWVPRPDVLQDNITTRVHRTRTIMDQRNDDRMDLDSENEMALSEGDDAVGRDFAETPDFDADYEQSCDKDATEYDYATAVMPETSAGCALELVHKATTSARLIPGSPRLMDDLKEATNVISEWTEQGRAEMDQAQGHEGNGRRPTRRQWMLALTMLGGYIPLGQRLQLANAALAEAGPVSGPEIDNGRNGLQLMEGGLEADAQEDGREEERDDQDGEDQKPTTKEKPWKMTARNMQVARTHLAGERSEHVQRPKRVMAETWDEKGMSTAGSSRLSPVDRC